MNQRVIISQDLEKELASAIADCEHDRIFVLTDTTTVEKCWPVISSYKCLSDAQMITIGATDMEKTLESTAHVWEGLQKGGATRHSLLINLGGGMITDLGGFAASTFKREARSQAYPGYYGNPPQGCYIQKNFHAPSAIPLGC